MAVATVGAWALAAFSWIGLCRMTARGLALGFDLNITWKAEKVFAHGGAPYAIRAFLYPPSCLLLLRPLAALDHHQMAIGGLIATAVIAWAMVMLSAAALGRRWWGFTAAITIWLLHFTEAMRGELSLENVTILAALALALCYLLALRGHWTAAGVVVGLSLSVKPLLLVVVLLFLFARQYKALAAAVVIPGVLNGLAFALVTHPGEVWTKLPGLLNRNGSGVKFNSAWVDVVRSLALPVGVSILLRLLTVVLVVFAAWLAWSMTEERLRIVTTMTVLLIGSFLAGTLSEYHFMLTLVPFFMTVVLAGSPMRSVPAALGALWTMGLLVLPPSWLALNSTADRSACRAFGMSLLVLSVIGVLLLRRREAVAVPGLGVPPDAMAGATSP